MTKGSAKRYPSSSSDHEKTQALLSAEQLVDLRVPVPSRLNSPPEEILTSVRWQVDRHVSTATYVRGHGRAEGPIDLTKRVLDESSVLMIPQFDSDYAIKIGRTIGQILRAIRHFWQSWRIHRDLESRSDTVVCLHSLVKISRFVWLLRLTHNRLAVRSSDDDGEEDDEESGHEEDSYRGEDDETVRPVSRRVSRPTSNLSHSQGRERRDYSNAPFYDRRYALIDTNTASRPADDLLLRQNWQAGTVDVISERDTPWEQQNFEVDLERHRLKPQKGGLGYNLHQLISVPLLLETLVEVFGVGGFTNEGVEGYKTTWAYTVTHTSGDATIDFEDVKGAAKLRIYSTNDMVRKAFNFINKLISRSVFTPASELQFRQRVSDGLRLRDLDARVLANYQKSWRHENKERAQQIREKIMEGWEASATCTKTKCSTVDITSSIVGDQRDFNAMVSPHQLLYRLLILFGPKLMAYGSKTWCMLLKRGDHRWLQIANMNGLLHISCIQRVSFVKRSKGLMLYLVSDDVVTPYDGLIAGCVA